MSRLKWMYHATAMGPSYDDLLNPLARLFGARVLHDNQASTPGLERRGGMVWIADNSIEIGEPLGAGSPLHRFLRSFGGGMHSIAVQVEDVDEAMAHASKHGVRVASQPRPGLAFTRPADTAGILIEWKSGPSRDDPRWGATLPPQPPDPVVTPERMAFVGLLAKDPLADAELLAAVIGTEATPLEPEEAGAPQALVDLRDCMLALYPIPSAGVSQKVWGGVHDRPRCLSLGLQVTDLGAAENVLATVGVHAHHKLGDGSLVLAGGTLPFPVVLVDHLIPGDPRNGPT